MTIMHEMYRKFTPERMATQQKNFISKERKILKRRRTKISDHLRSLKDSEGSYLGGVKVANSQTHNHKQTEIVIYAFRYRPPDAPNHEESFEEGLKKMEELLTSLDNNLHIF